MRKVLCCFIILFFVVAVHAQEIVDSITTQMLNEVVVEGASEYTSANKTTYLPDRNSKRTAQNAADLLSKMAIPQIVVNNSSGDVQTNGGQEVTIYIDYELATQAEKEALNPQDVKKVEYLIYPTDPRFGNNHYVINIILNHYDYGGYAKITGVGNILAGSGSGQAYVKTSYKRMTYHINFYDKYSDLGNTGTEQDQIFRFPQTDGTIAEIKRSTTLDNSRYQQNYIWGSFRARYDSDKTTISNTFSIISNNQPHADYSGRVVFSSPFFQTIESPFSNNVNTRSINPYWNGRFYFDMGRQWQLGISSNLIYNRTNTHSLYHSDETEIITDAAENLISMNIQGTLSKSFKECHYVGLWFYGGYIHDKVSYSGNTSASPLFKQYGWTIVPSYTLYAPNFSVSVNGGVVLESNSISGIKNNSIIPTAELNISYAPNEKNQLELTFNYDVNTIELSDKTPDILQVNELLWQTGNPMLKNKELFTINTDYTCFFNNKFALSGFLQWNHLFQFIAPIYTPDGPKGMMLRTTQNIGKYDYLNIGIAASLKLFNRSLVLTARPRLTYENLKGLYNLHLLQPHVNLSASYYLNNWYATLNFSKAAKSILEGEPYGIISREKDYYSLKIGWSDGKWNLSASAINIFRRNWLNQTAWINSEWYESTTKSYSPSSHQFINISISYTLNFGKKIKQGDEIQNSGNSPSAIMK